MGLWRFPSRIPFDARWLSRPATAYNIRFRTAQTGGSMFLKPAGRILALLALFSSLTFAQTQPQAKSTVSKKPAATPAQAEEFIRQVEKELNEIGVKANRAQWVQSNFITDDTEALAADANEQLIAVTTKYALQTPRFDGLKVSPELSRKLMLLKLSLPMPAPNNAAERAELTKIATSLEADYGKGKFCVDNDKSKCYDLTAAEKIMRTSRDPKELLDLWTGWHSIVHQGDKPMR